MQLQKRKQSEKKVSLTFSLKCGAILLFFLLSILVAACGGGANTTTNINGPVVTVTIRIGNTNNNSPTPALPDYWCGAWATQTSPGFSTTGIVSVYAKFTHNVNGNPEGVDGAGATATVLWADGQPDNIPATTTPDGLAVFSISTANRASAINKITLVTVRFDKPGVPTCIVGPGNAAFFTLVPVSPTAAPGDGTPTGTSPANPKATKTPKGFPGPIGTITITVP